MERIDSPAIFPSLLWHHRLHEEAGERLFFWRLSFAPTYMRDSAVAGIKAAVASCDVGSITAYEMFGVYDVLLRVWLPSEGEDGDAAALRFQGALLRELTPHGVVLCHLFGVDYVVRHWAFDPDHEPPRPQLRRLLRGGTALSVELGTASKEQLELLRAEGLLATPEPDPNAPGIKFALIVAGSPDRALSAQDRDDFEAQVTAILASARDIDEVSLYAGQGFGHFVILGRVDYLKYHELQSTLVAQLQAAPLRERFGATTSTHLSGQRGLLYFSESVAREDRLSVRSLEPPAEFRAIGELQPGSIFARRFQIVESLGEGGFGVVYHVRDSFEQNVDRALKIFPSAGDEAAQRELSMLRRVRARHVVEMFWGDRDEETGRWYLISEYVDGESLEAFIRGKHRSTLGDARSIEIVRQILDGLESIHPNEDRIGALRERARGGEIPQDDLDEMFELLASAIIHRDIKPANVMLNEKGVVKLIDFNIASEAGSQRGTNTGTPRYQPPAHVVTSQYWEPDVDLYAAGIVLYELLCDGEHPYVTAKGKGSKKLIPPEQHRPDLSELLLDVVKRSCTFPPGFDSAGEMRLALEAAWAGHQDAENAA